METFGFKWCYAMIATTVCFAMICRLIYRQIHEEEFDEHQDRKILDIKFIFTQIPLINNWMLFWSLAVMLVI